VQTNQTFGRRGVKSAPKPAVIRGDAASTVPLANSEFVKLIRFGFIFLAVMFASGFSLFLWATSQTPSPEAQPIVGRPEMFVITERAPRHTCAREACGIVGELYKRTKVEIYETAGGWARISAPYDAGCVDERSQYVDTMNDQCNQLNGIVDGKFAEWIELDRLSADTPADPAAGKSGIAAAMAHSDDYSKYGARFEAAATKAIQSGICTLDQIEASDGWYTSPSYKGSVYFMFCGERRVWMDMADLSVVKFDG